MPQENAAKSKQKFITNTQSIKTSATDLFGFVLTPDKLRQIEDEIRNRAVSLENASHIEFKYEIEWSDYSTGQVESVDQLVTMENHPRNPVCKLKLICYAPKLQEQPIFSAEFIDPFSRSHRRPTLKDINIKDIQNNPNFDPAETFEKLNIKSIEIKSESPDPKWSSDLIDWLKNLMAKTQRPPMHKYYFNFKAGKKLDGLLSRLQWLLLLVTAFWYIDFNNALNIKSFWGYNFLGVILFYPFLFRMFMIFLEKYFPVYNFVWGEVGKKFEKTERYRKQIKLLLFLVGIPLFMLVFINPVFELIDPRFIPSWIF